MNKGDLIEMLFTKEERNKIDTAYPQEWADKMRMMGVQPRWFCWSYNDPTPYGGPINLAERFMEKYGTLPELEHEDADYVGAIISAQHTINKALGLIP